MKIEADLPNYVHGITYIKNSHYIKLTDDKGNSTKLVPTSLLQGTCKGCKLVIYIAENHGSVKCPVCNDEIVWKWGNVQLCFVPEEPTDFRSPPQKK